MTVSCPHCQARLKFPDDAGAGRVRCPRCQEVFAVSSAPTRVPDRAQTPVRPAAPTPGGAELPDLFAAMGRDSSRRAGSGGFPTKAVVGGIVGCLALVGLGWLVFFSGLLGGSLEYGSYVPPGTIAIFRLNAAALRGSDLFKQVAGQMKGMEQKLWDEAKGLKLGLNDIDEVFVAGTGDKNDGVIVVRTAKPMGWNDLLAEPEKAKKESVEGVDVVEVKPGPNGVYAALTTPRTLCFAPSGQVLKDALARVRKGERPALDPELREIIARVRGYDQYLAVGSLSKLLRMAPLPLPPLVAGELGGVKGGGLGISVGSTIDLRVVAWFAEADKAKSIREKAQEGLAQALKDMDAARGHLKGDQAAMIERMIGVLRSVAIGQSGTTLIATARVDAETSKTFADQMAAQVGMLQGLASRGPAVQTPVVPGPQPEKVPDPVQAAALAAGLAKDASNLRQLAMACIRRSAEADHLFPKTLGEILDKGLVADKTLFVSTLDKHPTNLPNGVPCSYTSSFDRFRRIQFTGDTPGSLIMIWQKTVSVPGKHVAAFFDGHVETLSDADFANRQHDLATYAKDSARKK